MANGDKKRHHATKAIRDSTIIEKAIAGKTQKEIANEMNVNRHTVRRSLTGAESKRILQEARERVVNLVSKALITVEKAMDGADTDMTNGLKAALPVLETHQIITKNQNITHSFPKPTVIKRRDGSEVVLGSVTEEEKAS